MIIVRAVFVGLLVLASVELTTWAEEPKEPNAQEPIEPAPPLDALMNALELGQIQTTTSWSLYFQFGSKEDAPKSREQLVTELSSSIESGKGSSAERASRSKYMGEILTAVRKAPKLTGDSMPVIFGDGTEAVRFATLSEVVCVVIPGVAVETVYNTRRLDSKQRATRTATVVAIPFLKSLAEAFQATDVQCVAVGVAFGSKDFADDRSTKGEYLALAAALSDVRAFSEGDIAEEELLRNATVFLKDRDQFVGVKRVLLAEE